MQLFHQKQVLSTAAYLLHFDISPPEINSGISIRRQESSLDGNEPTQVGNKNMFISCYLKKQIALGENEISCPFNVTIYV